MAKNNGLRVFDLKTNNINGGSTQYFLCKTSSKYKTNSKKINNILKEEKRLNIYSKLTFISFLKKINLIRNKTLQLLEKLTEKNYKIHGYGASTKGNVLLQYFGISRKYINFIADRNPKKYNHFTPGTKINIISEKKSRKLLPNYYFVLPWHFKKEILKRESKIRKKGCKFIFPLPKLKIY